MSIICCDFKVILILILVYLKKVILKIYIYIFVFNILYIELWVCFFLKVFILIVDWIGGGRDFEFMFLVDILIVI